MTIARTALEAIRSHALREAPLECCGLLTGSGTHIRAAVAARNALASPSRFMVHPEDHFAAIRAARSAGESVLGAYHSHPATDARPSATDVAESEGDSSLLWLIVSLRRGSEAIDARLYRPRAGNFDPVGFVLVD
jgi:proteasome lid subunit RPN8/RPN11